MQKKERLSKECRWCKKIFLSPPYRRGYFCSQECASKGRKMREIIYVEFKCQNCGIDCKKPKYNTSSTFSFCSIQCMSIVRGKNMQGENHPQWKGGFSRPQKERKAVALAKSIKKKCEKCGSKENLHGHHKIKYSERPDLCDVVENIEVLCSQCHAKEHPELEGFISIPVIRKGVYLTCKVCEKKFYVPQYRKNDIYCSKKCTLKYQKTGFYRMCNSCNKEYYVARKKENTSKYCSNPCRYIRGKKC